MTKQEFLRELWNRLTELPQEDVEKSLDYYSEMIDDRVEDGLTEEEAVAEIGTAEEVAAQLIAELPQKIKERTATSAQRSDQFKPEPQPEQTAAAQNVDQGSPARNTVNNVQSTAGSVQNTAGAAQGTAGAPQNTAGTVQSNGYGTGGYHSYTPPQYYAEASAKKPASTGKIIALICTFPIWFPILIAAGAVVFSIFVTIWAVTFSLFVAAASFLVAGVAGVVLLFVLTISGEFAIGLVYCGIGFVLAGLGLFFMVFSGSVIRGVGIVSGKLLRGVGNLFGKRRAA